ncbi:MAG TPA: FtsX-like permease family protein, partial [Acidimicrobiales bacterium]|nr:FtsX-like permease family protein [Acidimicrobiales bacterium]
MIRLAARFVVSGGRESAVRLVLTALGVAVGTTLLLLAAAADPAIRAQQSRTAWQETVGDPAAHEGSGDPLLWWVHEDGVDGRIMTVLRVAGTGPDSPVPLGLGHVPEPGEVHVSPALASLLDELPADRLADRFPAAPSGTIGDDYLAGPDDLVAVVGMPADVMRAMDVPEIHRVRTSPPSYQFTDFLRVMFGIGAVGLLMPVLVFVSTSTRIGAARREQRFAALRLAGATPRQINLVAVVEAGAAAALGAVLGAGGFALVRPWAARIEIDGHAPFVDDVRVAPVLLLCILLAIPALAVVAATTSLRRLQISPLGVARRAVRSQPTARRLLPLVGGSASFVVTLAVAVRSGSMAAVLPAMAAFALMIGGIVAAGPWFTVLAARLIGRRGRRASALLAGRRLEDDPVGGFRAVSGLVLAVFVASVFSGVTPAVLAESGDGRSTLIEGSALVVGVGAVTSAEADAALDAAVAAGADRGIALHLDPEPDRPLTDPARGRSETRLVACADLAGVGITAPCPEGGTAWVDTGLDELAVEPAPYSPEELADLPVQLVVLETDGTTAVTDRARTAILQVLPGAVPRLAAEQEAEADRNLVQLNRLVNLALGLTLSIAGCSLAVAVAAGIIERRRPFTLLRLAGMKVAELQRTALIEAA